jgi:multimeric flavodoxin WrbA
MKKILLVNLSPRKDGTSIILLDLCKKYMVDKVDQIEMVHLYSNLNKLSNLYNSFKDTDTIVFSGPCYINTYPADTIYLLEYLRVHEELLHGQKLYGIIQGGMPYAHTHECGLDLLEMFSKKCNINYMGGFVMGLGAMLNGREINMLPNGKKVERQFNIFFEYINKGEQVPKCVYEKAVMKMPGVIYKIMAKGMNKKIDKDLKSRGIDVNQISPYLTNQ